MVTSNYRPFIKEWFYNDGRTTERPYQMPRIYPDGAENLTICVAGVGVKKDFSCLMTNTHTDLNAMTAGQCFPLYWYEVNSERKSNQSSIADFGVDVQSNGMVRHDGISDWVLEQAKSKYGNDVTKEDIFYYIYGYLHSQDYRAAFVEDLKMDLPRIDFVDSLDDFRAFSDAGRKLADLHLNYESVPVWKGLMINGNIPIESFTAADDIYKVGTKKMKIDFERGTIQYNDSISIGNVPKEAFEYVVNGRSALGWIAEMYHITTDKDTGIVNDPKEYSGGKYIFDLIGSIVTVSVETVKIQNSLPHLCFVETSTNGGE